MDIVFFYEKSWAANQILHCAWTWIICQAPKELQTNLNIELFASYFYAWI